MHLFLTLFIQYPECLNKRIIEMWITLSYAKERNNLLIIMILIQSSSPNGQPTVSYFSTLLKYDFFDSTYLFFVAHKMDKERGRTH